MVRPGFVVRGTRVVFGLLFLPLGLWFAWSNSSRYWLDALVLIIVSAAFLWLAFNRDEDSWMAAIDALGQDKPR
jgi:thiol:disulfide interchange protein